MNYIKKFPCAKHFVLLTLISLCVIPSTFAQTTSKKMTPASERKQWIDFEDLRNTSDQRTHAVTIDGYIYRVSAQNDRMVSDETARTNERDSLQRYSHTDSSSSQSSTTNQSKNQNSPSKKMFKCKVYCKSAGGPITWYEIAANNRSEAAKWVGDNANAICNSDGNSYASRHSFSESQCHEK